MATGIGLRVALLLLVAGAFSACELLPPELRPVALEQFRLRNVKSGHCLTAPTAADDATVRQQDCAPGDTAQVWRWQADGIGGERLANVGSGLCLAVADNVRLKAAPIIQSPCLDGPLRQWSLRKIAADNAVVNGSVAAGDAADGWCLDIGGGNTESGVAAILWPCYRGASQKWQPLEP